MAPPSDRADREHGGGTPLGPDAPGAARDPTTAGEDQDDWVFPFERDLHQVAPGLHEAQNAWMAQLDSLRAPDRKTHELIRMVCTVILRNPGGVRRHAMLAAEVGATWDEIAGSILLTEPSFGLLRGLEAMPHARLGYEDAAEHAADHEGEVT